MKAITLTQPWASLVAWGHKRVETRSWPTNYRGPLAIHASRRTRESDLIFTDDDDAGAGYMLSCLGLGPADLPYSAVLATCTLVHCLPITLDAQVAGLLYKPDSRPLHISTLELSLGNYAPGRYAWILEDVKPLWQPVLQRGYQGLWEFTPPSPEDAPHGHRKDRPEEGSSHQSAAQKEAI